MHWVREARSGHPRRRRRIRGALAAGAIAAALLLTVIALPDIGTPVSTNPLQKMVQLAVNPPVQAEPQPDRRVLHLIFEVTRTDDGAANEPGRNDAKAETWHAWRRADGSGREVRAGQPRLIDPAAGIIAPDEPGVEEPLVGGGTSMRPRHDGTTGSLDATIGGYPLSQALIDDLPGDPAALRARLIDLVSSQAKEGPATDPNGTTPDERELGPAGSAGVDIEATRPADIAARNALLFQGATDLLVSWLAPPALRSAALEVVGEIAGVKVREGTDSRGRSVIIATLAHDGHTEVYIDPTTSAVTGHRFVDAEGTVTREMELVAADWVAEVPEA